MSLIIVKFLLSVIVVLSIFQMSLTSEGNSSGNKKKYHHNVSLFNIDRENQSSHSSLSIKAGSTLGSNSGVAPVAKKFGAPNIKRRIRKNSPRRRHGIRKKARKEAVLAECTPQPMLVKLVENHATHIQIYPECIRINRCSGCCNSEPRSCLPTKSKFIELKYTEMNFLEKKQIPNIAKVEEHTECICGCTKQKKDCLNGKIYDDKKCTCSCPHKLVEDCSKKTDRVWNHSSCSCDCIHQECSTNFYIDTATCECTRDWETDFTD